LIRFDVAPFSTIKSPVYWKLRVYIDNVATSPLLSKVRVALAQFTNIELLDRKQGFDLWLSDEGDTLRGAESQILSRIPTGIALEERVDRTVSQIMQWAKWFNLLAISNQQSNLPIGVEVVNSSHQQGGAIHSGDRFNITLRNNSSRDLYFAVLDLASDGSVQVIYSSDSLPLPPGMHTTPEFIAVVPEGHDSSTDVLKAFATTEPIDFSFVEQGAVRMIGRPRKASGSGSGGPLAQLLGQAGLGTSRSFRTVSTGAWVTTQRSFMITKVSTRETRHRRVLPRQTTEGVRT
jgi:hypothetical protein